MKIAMIQTALQGSAGAQRSVLRSAIEFQKMGHEVEIFVNELDRERCFPELLKRVTVKVVPYPLKLRRFTYYWVLGGMLNIARRISSGFDLINNHAFPTEWAAYFAKKKLNIPVVWMCYEPPFWFVYPQERKRRHYWPLFEVFDRISVKAIDEIVVMSRINEELVRKAYGRSATLIREGVDVEFFHGVSGQRFRAKFGLEDNFVLLQVGALVYYKRPDDSIRALALLHGQRHNVKLVLVGPGPQEPLKELCRELGVEDQVIFLEYVSDDELAEIYAACDVLIFPAEQTWGLVVTEAMAAGRPVIVSDAAGASEIIENEVNGFVIPHEAPQQIAMRVERLMTDSNLRGRMGRSAYEYVRDNLSWENYAKDMEKIFKRALLKKK